MFTPAVPTSSNTTSSLLPTREEFKKGLKCFLLITVPILLLLSIIWGIGGARSSEMALHHAGLTKEQVSFIRFNFDLDDFIPQYEVSWYQGTREVECTVHAFTGQLLDMDYD